MEKVDITIIGAGIVGLAIASEITEQNLDVVILEKNDNFGQETSSRNSEVIHAGFYYPPGSLRAKFCVRGNSLIYEICKKYNIGHRNTGQIVIARNQEEIKKIEQLKKNGDTNGVPGLEIVDRTKLKKIEPYAKGIAGLYAPSSGIMDSHNLMKYFLNKVKENGAYILYNHEVVGLEKKSNEYIIKIKNGYVFKSKILINSAGLNSDKIAQMLGIDIIKEKYKLHYCKGEYFALRKRLPINTLIYPTPTPISLGTHVVLDLAGQLKIGPSAFFVDDIDYTVDENHKPEFYNFAKEYIDADIELEDLQPAMSGIRPELSGPGNGFRDFIIHHEEDKGLYGLINLIGIDSPGLTASPAIAEYVKNLIKEIYKK